MSQMLELMAAPFAACVVLVGIHSYLGMHVIQRKIIFVDLALAQIAALGATFGFLIGLGPHDRGAYFFSLGFAIVGAAIFSLTRMRHERIPQEAIIGIVYAVGLAAAILLADRAPEGAEHIKETLTGTLLWVRWPTVLKTAAIYAVVGVIHFLLRKRFMQISFNLEQAYAEKRYVRLWDFIFYVTFAFVITSSVAIAGILVVFSFLVIPAVIATLFATKISVRLALGWTLGIAASLIGMVASYRLDMPSGPSIVVSLGIALLLAGLAYSVGAAPQRGRALVRVLAGSGIVAGLLVAIGLFVTSGAFLHIAHEHDWEQEPVETHEHGSELHNEIVKSCGDDLDCVRERILAVPDWEALAAEQLREGDDAERAWWVEAVGGLDHPAVSGLLRKAAEQVQDPLTRLEIARVLLQAGANGGAEVAAGLLTDDTPPLIRDEAYLLIAEAAGREFDYDSFATEAENAEALTRIENWAASR